MKRSIYLKKTDWREARRLFRQAFEPVFPLPAEQITVPESLHRITCEEVSARIASPPFDAAAMDGIAVQAALTYGATQSNPVHLKIGADCAYIDTGAPLEQPFDAVIKIEDVEEVPGGITVTGAVPPGKDVRFAGEDFAAGEVILPENHRIRPVDIGAMLGCGMLAVSVRKRPRVGIIPTGSEIVEPGTCLKAGDIIDTNSFIAANLIREWGGEPDRTAIVRNEKGLLSDAISAAVAVSDVVMVIAGSSAGREDFTPQVLGELGTVLVHGVDLMPGKPVVLARIEEKPVVGLPGYPVSAFVILDLFVRDIVAMALGIVVPERRTVKAVLEVALPSKLGMDEMVRVKLRNEQGTLHAMPLKRGAGILKSVVQADGLMCIPKDKEGFNAGQRVTVELLGEVTAA